jgi:hypothetical protein
MNRRVVVLLRLLTSSSEPIDGLGAGGSIDIGNSLTI